MTDYIVSDTDLTAVADKIRSKGGTSAQLEFPTEFISAIEAITGGGGGGGSIAHGTTVPTASQGSDGDLYVQEHSLPSNVVFVEYLQSSGTQYIDTGLYGNQDTGFFYDMDTSIAAWGFGARTNSIANALVITSNGTSTTSETITYGSQQFSYSNLAARRSFKLIDGSLYVDGVLARKHNVASFTTPLTLLLFGVNCNDKSPKIQITDGGYKLYRAIIYDGIVPIADYIPCLDGNGVACMWDNIAQEYVYNDGTGDFTYGSTVTPEPLKDTLWVKQNGVWTAAGEADDVNTEGGSVPADDPFALTEYIESSGTQYIDTGYLPSESSRFEAIVKIDSSSQPQWATIFGKRNIRETSQGNAVWLGCKNDSSNNITYNWGNSNASFASNSLQFGEMVAVSIDATGFELSRNGRALRFGMPYSGGNVSGAYSVYIFTLNAAGSSYGAATICSMKLYRFRVYEDDALVMELLPYEDNGEACLKDSITGNLYKNIGTGAFTFGTDE